MPTRAIRKTGDGWLAMGSSQDDIAWLVDRQVFPAKCLLMDGKIEGRFITQGVRRLNWSLVQSQPVVESDGAIVIEPTSALRLNERRCRRTQWRQTLQQRPAPLVA